jgi:hypothetical protein
LGLGGSSEKEQSCGNDQQVWKSFHACRNRFCRQGFQVGADLIGHVYSPVAPMSGAPISGGKFALPS